MDEPFASGLSTPPEKSETSFLTSMEFLIQLKKSTLGGEAMRGGLEAVAGEQQELENSVLESFFDEF